LHVLLQINQERSKIEEIVMNYEEWVKNGELCGLVMRHWLLHDTRETNVAHCLYRTDEGMLGAKQLFNEAGQDPELREMAREEIKSLETRQEELEDKLMILMLPKARNAPWHLQLSGRISAFVCVGRSSG
jgi:protein subunit release factor A